MAEVYEKLRERLDMFPQGFPKTQSFNPAGLSRQKHQVFQE